MNLPRYAKSMNVSTNGTPSGILVVNAACQILYQNCEAGRLISQINRAQGTSPTEALPLEIVSLCRDIQKRMESRTQAHTFCGPHRTLWLGTGHRPVVLRGFGLPAEGDGHEARILIQFIEEAAP